MKKSVLYFQNALRWIGHTHPKDAVKLLFRMATAGKRPLPDFLIIGAQKAGTSSLYAYLIQHPQILSARKKEIHFFDINYHKGVRWYRSNFHLRSRMQQGMITGEASPYYLFHPHAPRRISRLLPKVKLIVLLRNPTDRAISHYFMEVHRGIEHLPITEAFQNGQQRVRSELKKVFKDSLYISFEYQHFSYLECGIYIDQLLRYEQYFDKQQILILKSEEFFSNTQAVLKQVLSFLGVQKDFVPADMAPRRIGDYKKGEVPTSVRQYLNAYFAPFNQKLYLYLGQDLAW